MLKPSPLFTDGAVLCRGKEIRIFGSAAEGAEVTAILTDRTGAPLAEGRAQGRNGRFLARLSPQEAQTGCRLIIADGKERFIAEDICVGEVFLAGGQSNMELELRNADEGPELIAGHSDSRARFFTMPRRAREDAGVPEAEQGRWQAVSPGEGGGNSAVAYFFAAALRKRLGDVPVGIIGCYWGGTSITCWLDRETLRTSAEGNRYLEEYEERTAGKTMEVFLREEASFTEGMDRWNAQVESFRQAHPGASWKEVSAACGPAPWCPPEGPGSPYRPGGLAKTMLEKVGPVTLTGILYYQGEEDAEKTDRYDELMLLLIRRWRALFRDDRLPFLFVQLPMYIDFDTADTFRWPAIRRAQAAARDAARNTGMVCLLDQGEYGNIHPTAKRPVGERLAGLAGFMLYGGGEVSPRALSKYTQGGVMTVCLSAPVTAPGGGEAALLEIAGEDGVFMPAKAAIRGDRILLEADGVSNPVAARYAWTDYSDRVNLFGENGLPLEPFVL